jgi:hypothetical protein
MGITQKDRGKRVLGAVDADALHLDGTLVEATAANLNALTGTGFTALHKHLVVEDTPVNAAAASGTLTISGTVSDGETVTINGVDVYELDADGSVAGGNIAVDISSGTKTQATGTLTFADSVSDGEIVTIGDETYEFDTNASVTEGNIAVDVSGGASGAQAAAALETAYNTNTTYDITADADGAAISFECDSGGDLDGSLGNAITTTTDADNGSFAAGTLTGGSDATAAEAVTALVTAVTESDTQGVGAADGDGNTVVFTADTKGAAGNSITTETDMANGEFEAEHLEDGVDCTPGTQWEIRADASNLYVCVAETEATSASWRKISLGSAY